MTQSLARSLGHATGVVWRRLLRRKRAQRPRPPVEKPTADDFRPEAVRRAVLARALQHPATLLPLSVCAVGALWNTVLGVSDPALVATLLSGFAGLSSWVFQFIIRGDVLAKRHIGRLRELRAEHQAREGESIAAECERAGFAEGAKEARELRAAYQKLDQFLLARAADEGDLGAERFRVLAEDSYQEGVAVLRRALTLFTALRSIDASALEAERRAWQAQRDQAPDGERAALERRIEAHEKRLAHYRERERLLPELLAEANEIETALERAHLEAVDLVGADAAAQLAQSGTAARLQQAIDAARSVEARLRAIGHDERGDEREYLDAGRQPRVYKTETVP
jgi:hypothetical protein